MYLTQTKYIIDIIKNLKLENYTTVATPLQVDWQAYDPNSSLMEDPSQYWRLVGRLLYLDFTRSDLTHAVHHFSEFMQQPTNNHWHAALYIVKYLRGTTSHRLFYSNHSDLILEAYCDADWARFVKELKYADSHEWVKIDGNSATVGVTDHAQSHLGDVVYVELPEVGASVTQGAAFGAVESVKATSDINSPVSGKVTEVNEELSNSPALMNSSPYGDGWIMKVEMSSADDAKHLMDGDRYSKFCEEEDANH
ncbi:hypothetical protein LIER_28904 [Lithospermum erythrorhizon]|uniref:Glycine cleavage system H protein n=1 Tax=Lithospermum erythrorhizon TaxID=34254 RepID=A0AAV3RJ61_LITER